MQYGITNKNKDIATKSMKFINVIETDINARDC